ncbi:chitooligosaccharidolytic beta-N-acetylglucosaminidase [Ischnura elegans]|uniref:chitooligosaccharidolytic beta-N-acetylglucosaminidase n=1 Tax=Ischnura elegans TaxID=197161 RepID=UPI001ED86CC4|nr:chitooligosaccharidolytic beta-N-acetylglucosaminidase [Ischnura elegans]
MAISPRSALSLGVLVVIGLAAVAQGEEEAVANPVPAKPEEAPKRANGVVWGWECDASKGCRKVSLDMNPNAVALDVCMSTCRPYGGLWPRPTGRLQRGNDSKFELIDVNGISVEWPVEADAGLVPILKSASDVFKGNVMRLLPNARKDQIPWDARHLKVKIALKDAKTKRITLDTDESYDIEIDAIAPPSMDINVRINAANFFGARNALETISQLTVMDDVQAMGVVLPTAVYISDAPMFPHRGVLIDSSRNFITVPEILKTIDGMAASKLNSLHWHITDSQSFPFVSTSLPLMSTYGAISPDKVYTPEDVMKVVEYARVRGVRVIPELDAPAHVGEGWQWAPNLTVCFHAEPWQSFCVEPPCGQLDPTEPGVYPILHNIYKDMLSLFDSDVFHMGGDEVNFNCWNSSTQVVNRMPNGGRSEKDFINIWADFQRKAYAELVSANDGKKLPVALWTSHLIQAGSVADNIDNETYIVQIWTTGQDKVIGDLVKAGFRIIMSNYDALYLDCGWGAWVGTGVNWCSPYKGWQVQYDNRPLQLVTEQGVPLERAKEFVIGAEAALWSEQVDGASLDSKIWPRAAAMGERLWSDPDEGWKEAEHRMLRHRERLVERGVGADSLEPLWCLHNQGSCYL